MIFLYKLIDLTHSLHSTIPTWNGGCGFNHALRYQANYSLSAEDVSDFESKYGIIPKGSCVMVKTGWSFGISLRNTISLRRHCFNEARVPLILIHCAHYDDHPILRVAVMRKINGTK